ncbi:MAG: hypothetical protein RL238_528 [Actinomycetota bacterium]
MHSLCRGAALCIAATAAIAFAQSAQASSTSAPATECTRGTFADYHLQGQPGDPGKGLDTFRLSQQYPDSMPEPEALPWADLDVSTMSDDVAATYIDEVFAYVLEGNLDVDWVAQDNAVRTWYHAPWLDATKFGREYLHGLTRERDAQPLTLAPTQTELAQTWSIGAFNAPGGWAIGQMWCNPDAPDPDQLRADPTKPNSLPDGTVIYKLLFTTADATQVPLLEGTKEWQADIADLPPATGGSTTTVADPPRSTGTVHLIQIDVAVRDDRLPLGWAFGTFAHVAGSGGVWNDMVPVGLQWGNDPGLTPAMQAAGQQPVDQWINPTFLEEIARFDTEPSAPQAGTAPDRYFGHLGWAGRLAGPLDNPMSSCMSCHMTAGVPAVPIVPSSNATDRVRLAWFVDTPSGVAYSPVMTDTTGTFVRTSTDYSLQLSMGVGNFLAANCRAEVTREVVSPRGPDRASPLEEAQALCDEIVTAASAASSSGISKWWLVVAALGGFAVATVIGRRRGAGRTTQGATT